MKPVAILLALAACTTADPPIDPPPASPPTRPTLATAAAPITESDTPRTIAIVAGMGTLAAWDFGAAVVGHASASLIVTVSNDTGAATGVLTATVDPPFELGPATNCQNAALAPGATCTVQLNFRPAAVGPASGAFSISATPGGSTSLALSGVGSPPPRITLSPPWHDFSVIEFGHPATQAFHLVNTGPDLAIASIATAQMIGSGFTLIANTCPAMLPSGAGCDVTIQFAPSTFGQDAADLVVTTNLGTITQGANFVGGYGGGRITVAKAGSGSGSVASDGGGVPDITCGSECTGIFINPAHTLTATADAGSIFAGWSITACGNATTCDVTAGNGPVVTTATFETTP